MALAIHRGEQLLKDVEAYQQLQRLQGSGLLTWIEQKNFHHHRREAAKELQKYAQRALERGDYESAQRGLKVVLELYGDDLQGNSEQRAKIEQGLALTNRQLQQAKPQPAKIPKRKNSPLPLAELQHALDTGDLQRAQQLLDRIRQQSPQHPQLLPLELKFQTQLNNRVQAAIKQGNNLYSQGKIERALAVWRDATTLAPNNVELLANIARAEKVLENLRALSKPISTRP